MSERVTVVYGYHVVRPQSMVLCSFDPSPAPPVPPVPVDPEPSWARELLEELIQEGIEEVASDWVSDAVGDAVELAGWAFESLQS